MTGLNNIKRHLRRFGQEQSGSGLVEFSLSLSLLLISLFGVLEVSRLVYLDHYIGNAARDGSRYAMVRGSTWAGTGCTSTGTFNCVATSQNVTNRIIAVTPVGMSTVPLTVTTVWPGKTAAGTTCDVSSGANSPNCVVQVTVTYAFDFMIPLLPKNALTLSSASSVTIAQ